MKTGLTLEQLAAEITRQQSAKEDYVVNTGNLRLESYGPDLTLRVLDSDGADRIEPLEIGDIAHRQIGTHLSSVERVGQAGDLIQNALYPLREGGSVHKVPPS